MRGEGQRSFQGTDFDLYAVRFQDFVQRRQSLGYDRILGMLAAQPNEDAGNDEQDEYDECDEQLASAEEKLFHSNTCVAERGRLKGLPDAYVDLKAFFWLAAVFIR